MALGQACLLAFRRVSYAYPGADATVLTDFSLSITEAEGVALLGGNGAGKTTLLRLAMALLRPQSGMIEVAGRPTHDLAPEDLARQVGFLFQVPEGRLFEQTVRDEVSFGLRQLGCEASEIPRRVAAALDDTGLQPVAHQHPYDLPVPTRRLVALAAVLASDPVLLLLDEPTAGLDRATRERVRNVLLERRRRGVAVVAATHDGELALEALDRGVVLGGSRLIADGPVAELLDGREGVPELPAPAKIARALGLPAESLRADPVAQSLAEHCRSLAARVMLPEPDSPPSP